MIRNVLTLFKSFFEIILFRKGPEAIPHSSVLFILVAGLWMIVGVIAIVGVDTYSGASLFMDLVVTLVALSLYALVMNVFGKPERIVRALTAILGCGVVFGAALFVSRAILSMSFGEGQVNSVALLIIFWSIAIEGHIIARTIERLWVVGFLVALTVFITQLQLISVLKPFFAQAS